MTVRTRVARLTVALLVAGVVQLPGSPASAAAPPGRTTLVTVAHDTGLPASRPSSYTGRGTVHPDDLTPDGSLIVFEALHTNLVPGDTNAEYDIFLRDLEAGETERVSVSSAGEQADNASHSPSISADGRMVAFDSDATNLVPDDTNGFVDVFVHDRETGTTGRVSVTSAGEQLDRDAHNPRISADGRYVAFTSGATNLGPKTSTLCDEIYIHDRETAETERVSLVPDGGTSRGICTYGSTVDLSADGRFVAFDTQMHDLVEGDLNATWDIFVRDRQIGETERVSVSSRGREANYLSYNPRISDDGRFVTFYSCASNLVPNDNNSSGPKATGILGSGTCFDTFVHDRATGKTERVSVSSDGREGDFGSTWSQVSEDGRFVAFPSNSTTFGEPTYDDRIWVHDRVSGQTEWVSVSDDGTSIPAGYFAAPVLSADGRYVLFRTTAEDVYVRDRGPVVGAGGMTATRSGDRVEVNGWARFGGTRIADATDPMGDGEPARLGGDLVGASIAYRPEEADLLVRLDLSDLATTSVSAAATNYLVPGLAGAPGILHTLGFTHEATRYEVRAVRDNVEEPAYPPPPLLSLWECDPGCAEIAHLRGTYGGTGETILVELPLETLGAGEGDELTNLSATAAVGHALTGAVQVLDSASLPGTVIPRRSIELAVAPAGTPIEEVSFETAIAPGGAFSTSLDVEGSQGDLDVWVRACLGGDCSILRAEA